MTWTAREKFLSAAFVISLVVVAILIVAPAFRVRNVGKIRAVGVALYWDAIATQVVTQIDWGYMGPGELKGATVYIRNIKSLNCTLSQNSTDWSPLIAEQFLTPDWNYTGEILAPGQQIPVLLTLQVSIDVQDVTDFSFTWEFVATEA